MFVPSNEALRKIPDEELEIIKNNSTALRGEYCLYICGRGNFQQQFLGLGKRLAECLQVAYKLLA